VHRYVLRFEEVDRTQIMRVGGKGAHLGELVRIGGIRVPPGCCITTDAWDRVIALAPELVALFDRLSHLQPGDNEAIRSQSADARAQIGNVTMPGDITTAITEALVRLGDHEAYAVRSSATAEDLPDASFAGQQDTWLNVVGTSAVLEHVRKCWASLYTERAVTYRLRNGIDHRQVRMGVVLQRMAFPEAAGIVFTADPATGNRRVSSIDASFGLGEALVSGLVNADSWKVRDDAIVARSLGTKQLAITPLRGGGTREQAIAPGQQRQPALTDEQLIRLARTGRRIEAHFGHPQDIEWCLVGGEFHIVQSRPITTLFPIPESGDRENHVYISVGHQQMMTDAMKPLGLSVWQLTTARPMAEAGSRLFVDVTQILASPAARAGLLWLTGKSDPLLGDALQNVVDRDGFLPPPADGGPGWAPPGAGAPSPMETDPAIVADLIARSEGSIALLKRDIATREGPELFDFIRADIAAMKRQQFDPRSLQAVMAGIEATWWLNDKLLEWLGEKNAADVLTQSAPHNVTSEMGLALLDVADAIRPHRQVVARLHNVTTDDFLDALPALDGGPEARSAIEAWLETYGMRGVGEIDITRPRWRERPSMLLPVLLANIETQQAGAAARRFEQGRQEALKKEQDLLTRLRTLPEGAQRAGETKRMIDRLRTFIGYREYPKFAMISRYSIYKQALLREAERLVKSGVMPDAEDIFFLRFDELHDVVRANGADQALIQERKDMFRSHRSLRPPRVMTSEGESVAGVYRRADLPPGALVGVPVSSGIVEGRARVIFDLADANLDAGDILVTRFTDPSWTPLFVSIRGVVTEVGGLMTHGAVIAREYGLPGVVGVENATQLIRDGQQIRVNGTDGCVTLLS
jgi:phosphoenolpyruvate synthase/pyruvate phosphate dikinase